MKNILGVLLISMSVIVSAQNSIRPVTGIIAMDCSGKTWDFDSLLNAGIHVVIHETISTWQCIPSGAGLQNAYNKFGKNAQRSVLLVAGTYFITALSGFGKQFFFGKTVVN